MCQINPSSFNCAQESDAVKLLREQLSHQAKPNFEPKSVIKDPQSAAVLELMQRLLQQG